MITDKNTAEHVSKILLGCTAEINELIRFVQNNCSEQEFNLFRDAMSKIMIKIFEEGLEPLFNQNPDLKPDQLK